MSRTCLLACALLCTFACNGDKDSQDAGHQNRSAATTKPPPESPTTGISQIQKMHDELKADIAVQEERVKAGQPAQEGLVRGQLTGIDILIRSTEMALALDTRQSVLREHGILRRKQAAIMRARNQTYAEIDEMNSIVKSGSIPAGMTEAEIQDRLKDFKKSAEQIEKDWEELRGELRRKEELLALDVIPPQGESLFSKELQALKATRKRVEALLDE